MAVTVSSLQTRYPEFANVPSATVQAAIDDAALMIDSAFWGNKSDMGITALAAHYIAINPLGEFARLDKKREKTVYWMQYQQIMYSLGAGCRTI